jgi:peroxiredoxin
MNVQIIAATVCTASLLFGAAGCANSESTTETASGSSIGAKPGDRIDASSVTLRTASGSPVDMDMILEDGPVVVVFYRGSWCPYCEKALDGWDEQLDELNASGGRLIALTPDAPSNVAETLTKQDLGFTVLSDANGEAARALGVNFIVDSATRSRYLGYGIDLEKSNANGLWQLPHPGTFIIDRSGTVRYANVSADYQNGRADPAEVIAAYRRIAG